MIIWLASYPKSGNTWVRLFLNALFYAENELDINNIKIQQFPNKKHFKNILENFNNLEYVNVNAPKGGEISFWAFGSFDSMHPYTRKGRAGAYSSIFFESLLEKIKRETIKVVFFAKFVSETNMKSFDNEETISGINTSENSSNRLNSLNVFILN